MIQYNTILYTILRKEMATHSNIHAWRIPWTEKPGRLQSMGLQRVRPNGETCSFTFNLISAILLWDLKAPSQKRLLWSPSKGGNPFPNCFLWINPFFTMLVTLSHCVFLTYLMPVSPTNLSSMQWDYVWFCSPQNLTAEQSLSHRNSRVNVCGKLTEYFRPWMIY